MTKDPVFRKAPLEASLKCIDVIDTFADERALAEHILIHVGDGAGVGVDAGLAAEQSRIVRLVSAGKAHCHARLQDAVALSNALLVDIKDRTVERVRHGSDKLPGGVTRQLRICVEGDDVLHVWQECRRADDA